MNLYQELQQDRYGQYIYKDRPVLQVATNKKSTFKRLSLTVVKKVVR